MRTLAQPMCGYEAAAAAASSSALAHVHVPPHHAAFRQQQRPASGVPQNNEPAAMAWRLASSK